MKTLITSEFIQNESSKEKSKFKGLILGGISFKLTHIWIIIPKRRKHVFDMHSVFLFELKP